MRAAFAEVGIDDLRLTEQSGDEARLVHAALDAGAETIAVLGGDGTWGKCAAAVAASRSDARLAFLQGGTGNDFAKNFDAPATDFDAMARLIAEDGNVSRVDMGRLASGDSRDRRDGSGERRDRGYSPGDHADWFLNVVGFGFDVAVLERTAHGGALSGRAVYVAAALRELLDYPGFDVAITAENGIRAAGADNLARPLRRTPRAMMLVVSNGFNFGGAFRIAPAARVDDGLLDLVQVGDVRGIARVPLLLGALRGAHLSHPQVTSARAPEFTLRFANPPAYEIDGDLRPAHSAELRISCVPGAIRVLTGAAPVPRRPPS